MNATGEQATPFLHARVTVELPFDLALSPGLYPLKLPSSNAALPIFVKTEVAGVLGYAKDPTSPLVLRHPRHFGVADSSGGDSGIADWVNRTGLDRAVLLPANTILELWIGFAEPEFPSDVRAWAEADQTKKLILFLLNNFLCRYQVASGFTPAAGYVGAVSELELRHLSVQLFSGDSPRSSCHSVIPALPAQPARRAVTAPADMHERLQVTLQAPAMPLWLELAHEAHSLLFRGRSEQSILGWIQALEVAVGQCEAHLQVVANTRATVEERLEELLSSKGRAPLEPGVRAELVNARRLRNSIVHDGLRLRFDDTRAERVADAVIAALALVEDLFHVEVTRS
jgi:hypothetical protein